MQPGSDRYHKRALKVAAAVSGVVSITVAGRDSDQLLVIGDGVDESVLIKKLRRVLGEAEIVELHTLAAGASASGYLPGTSRDVVAAQYPVSARSPLANTGAARLSGDHRRAEATEWPGEEYRQPEAGYLPQGPSPSYYQAAPLAGNGGYGESGYSRAAAPLAGNGGYGESGYSRAAARSHPGNYSPMTERDDYLAGGRSHLHGGGRQPKCCSIQ